MARAFPRWREWSRERERAEQARAAYLFLNMVRCSDCGLPWPEGYVHFDCPGPAPEVVDKEPNDVID